MFTINFGTRTEVTRQFNSIRVWGPYPTRVYANAVLKKKDYEYDSRVKVFKLAMSRAPAGVWSLAMVMPLEDPGVHIGSTDLKDAESGT